MKIKLSIIIVLCAWSYLSIGSEAICICKNTEAGTHCGQNAQMSACLTEHLYQCDGRDGSEAHHYGLCIHGCVQKGKGNDYCPLEAGDCICLNTCGGKHCGQSILMGDKCLENHIYQCNGIYGSVAHHYGPCTDGCVIDGCSLDYCRLKQTIV